MAAAPKKFQAMLRALERNGARLSEPENTLKRMPRGFETLAGSPIAAYFRYPSFIVSEQLSDPEVMRADLVQRIVGLAKQAKPLLDYGWKLTETESA
jgi:uncharacterized protein (DUF2461 family)